MICMNCEANKMLRIFEEYIISSAPNDFEEITKIFDCFMEKAKSDGRCCECGRKIVLGEMVLEDDSYIENILKYFSGKVMKSIECCERCGQGQDIQSIWFAMQRIFNEEDENPEEMFEEYNTSSTIEELLYEVFAGKEDEWEDFFDNIVEKIECPKCGSGSGIDMDEKIDYGKFDRYTDIYTKYDIDLFNHKFYGDALIEAADCANDLARECSLEELVDLKNDYIENKVFVCRNKTFRKLEDVITKLYTEEMYYELSVGRMVYRARPSKTEELLNKDELWEPPINCASHGRYNDIGTSLLYCANNIDVIKQEVSLSDDNDIYSIGKFAINTPRHLFPINFVFEGEYSGLVDAEVPISEQNDKFKQKYVICNIVSAICAKVGYDGIVYRSTKDRTSVDYALFCNFQKGIDIECIDVIYEK